MIDNAGRAKDCEYLIRLAKRDDCIRRLVTHSLLERHLIPRGSIARKKPVSTTPLPYPLSLTPLTAVRTTFSYTGHPINRAYHSHNNL